jgi:hypothetical protein
MRGFPGRIENGLRSVLTAGVEYTERLVEGLRLKDSAPGTKVSEGLVVTLAGTVRHPRVSIVCHKLTACR